MTATMPHTQSPVDGGVAGRLAEALEPFVGGELPVRLIAWDGSEAGPANGPLVELRSADAVRRLLWHPGELGAAQAAVDPDDLTDRVVMATRRAVFPLWGLDPWYD